MGNDLYLSSMAVWQCGKVALPLLPLLPWSWLMRFARTSNCYKKCSATGLPMTTTTTALDLYLFLFSTVPHNYNPELLIIVIASSSVISQQFRSKIQILPTTSMILMSSKVQTIWYKPIDNQLLHIKLYTSCLVVFTESVPVWIFPSLPLISLVPGSTSLFTLSMLILLESPNHAAGHIHLEEIFPGYMYMNGQKRIKRFQTFVPKYIFDNMMWLNLNTKHSEHKELLYWCMHDLERQQTFWAIDNGQTN